MKIMSQAANMSLRLSLRLSLQVSVASSFISSELSSVNFLTIKFLISQYLLADFEAKLKIYRSKPQSFGRIIEVHDFLNAAMILRSGYPDFHNERFPSLLLSDEQKKPEKGQYQKSSMFVVSHTEVLTKLKQPYMLEQPERQVFHEFDRDANNNVQYYRLHMDADATVNIIATEEEMKYCKENLKTLKKLKERQLVKDMEMCKSGDS